MHMKVESSLNVPHMTALMWVWDKCLGAHEIQKRYYTKGFIRIEIALFIASLSFQMYWSEGQKEN